MQLVVAHERDRAAGGGRVPGRGIEGVERVGHVQIGGQRLSLRERFHGRDHPAQLFLPLPNILHVGLHGFSVGVDLDRQVGAGGMHQVAVMVPFEKVFQAQSDQDSDRDNRNVEQKVFPRTDRPLHGMDFHSSPSCEDAAFGCGEGSWLGFCFPGVPGRRSRYALRCRSR